MTAAEQKLDQVYAHLGFRRGPGVRPPTLAQVRDAAITLEFQATGFNQEATAKNLGRSRSFIYDWVRFKQMAAARQMAATVVVVICACLCPVVSHAQVKGAALLLPALAVADVKTNKTQTLTWTSSEDRFAIRTGTNRASLGPRFLITSNSLPYQRGLVYSVAAVNTVGVESAPAYFPSNRVGALIEQTSVNLTTWTDGRTLETFTNTPARPQMYLRIVDRTTGWLPPN